MSGRSQHILSFHPWRSRSWPSPLDPFLPGQVVAFPRSSHQDCLMGTLITSVIRTFPSRRGRSTQSVLRKLWFALSSMMSSPPTNIQRPCVPWLSSAVSCSSIPQLHLRIILFYALHPLFDVACCSRGLVGLLFPSGMSWFLGIFLFFTTVSAMGWWSSCTVLIVILTWACL